MERERKDERDNERQGERIGGRPIVVRIIH